MSDDKVNNTEDIKSTHNQWIADGVLYNEHIGGLTIGDSLVVIEKSVKLLDEQKLEHAPIIVIFKDIDKTTFRLSLADYSKLISSFRIVERVSEIWIVNAPEDVRKMIHLFSSTFLGNRMHFTDNLQEAQAGAREHVTDPTPILEKDA